MKSTVDGIRKQIASNNYIFDNFTQNKATREFAALQNQRLVNWYNDFIVGKTWLGKY